jgi:hypothetical protein
MFTDFASSLQVRLSSSTNTQCLPSPLLLFTLAMIVREDESVTPVLLRWTWMWIWRSAQTPGDHLETILTVE